MTPQPAVTWIHIDKPHIDLVRFLLTSLAVVGVFASIALVLGTLLGLLLILRSRRLDRRPPALVNSLGLGATPPGA